MKYRLIKILVGSVLALAGWFVAEQGDKTISQESIQELQDFCENSAVATGVRRDSSETGYLGDYKFYIHTYDFHVGGVSYTSKLTTNLESPEKVRKIWYNKLDFQKSSTNDPCLELERDLKGKRVGTGKFLLYGIGAFLIFVGLSFAWGFFKEALVTLIRGARR
ncbi:MAG: hypothetical protein IPN71_06250 [Fibrobacteres bacterium]|nr:hypothetical protein [Fibrobacterota bacterium]